VELALREIERTGGYASSRLELADEQGVGGWELTVPEDDIVGNETE
jgi:hypothetical protein